MNTESNNSAQMSNDLIRQMIENYRQNHLNAINSTLGIDDAHSIWFDLPKLKNFIATIEEEAKRVNPDCSERDLGIRFYYASYPSNADWNIMESHPVPMEYAGKHTLVMVPTSKGPNENGEICDYDFNSVSTDGSTDGTCLGENNGTLIPPSLSFGESF